ncbi:transferrin receptor protein 2 isoform X1 [Ictalurus furcatus]|uniref:transferrin receptor protein 2 isoform X1 n=1 Tax=Ictalurus furcatus TaxID=66913 RepID=UPI002350A103|nr:transferrin receptor protein 2 isoform X1 [Ictalurus furcatus]XP_053498797.1 transferrin receptor protein 2 isoform X1 [Ictalurus furcatus]XP_053498798.1 transferrin receptor protein 2 isoform X1 [Ictalurus furcatus]XP_053498799.1 transferrin receptor protein 2 isoform X1 [Ictalurus furcatus]XP_053498800.1 transferrin receptor protein 2 isoform X1 [Ictalurus furcatus]XP_053498801.1 transferrin receptor protein 2 isoform X1 [Ictalurus furcatus]XP_053498803.1 transferrin receptor protein 2 i
MADPVRRLLAVSSRDGAQVEEVGGVSGPVSQVELKLVQSGSEAGSEAGLNNDVTGLMQRQRLSRRKAVVYLTLIGLLIFTTAFLLGYVSSRGTCPLCVDEGELVLVDDTAGPDHSPKTGGMYLGELKDMLKKYLQEEKIEDTVQRVSRTSHPAGSSEGHALAMEILQSFQNLHMDHTWTDSHYATLQFPSSMQRNALWLVDAEGVELEEILLDRADYCAYSATGTATGGVVYVNYARQEDFDQLRKMGVTLNGSIAVARVGGGVSFAEKVWHAQEAGHVGILIYPDPADIPQDPRRLGLHSNAAISEHVHLGSGDPFTPGFPSFNHTQFPPTQSSGLPIILAQPISANVASKLLSQLSGMACPRGWSGRLPYVRCVLGPEFSASDGRKVKMAIYNTMTSVLLNNIFASIEGKVEPDHYIIMGAQRDSWGPGAVKSGVGTAVLLELARIFSTMVQNGFSPRRSLLFVSWDAGEFGNVGATEWLEGYLSMLHLKAVAYFSLDQAVMGDDTFSVSMSPLLADLIEGAIKQVEHPKHVGQSIMSVAEAQGGWRRRLKPLYLNSGAYSFTAFGGVPAMELRFHEEGHVYPFVNTQMDSVLRLQERLQGRVCVVGRAVAELVGLMVLRLAHDHIIALDITHYSTTSLKLSAVLTQLSAELQARGLSPQWVYSARGDYSRAAKTLQEAIKNTDIQDERTTRLYNTRLMRVEYYFLSQYVSVVETPFRHVLHGRGEHTLSALTEHLSQLRSHPHLFHEARFRRQLALFTWTLQGAANALSGDVWNIDNLF